MSEEKENKKHSEELSAEELEKVTGGASDSFLKIDGIEGESTSTSNKDWIEILSFNHSAS